MKRLNIEVDGKKYEVGVEEETTGSFTVEFENKKYKVKANELETVEHHKTMKRSSQQSGSKNITAPITGTVGKIFTKESKPVKTGDVLLTLIAMKMENEIKAQTDGKVKKIHVKVGDNVEVGHELIELE